MVEKIFSKFYCLHTGFLVLKVIRILIITMRALVFRFFDSLRLLHLYKAYLQVFLT